jgi:hypothetical protein
MQRCMHGHLFTSWNTDHRALASIKDDHTSVHQSGKRSSRCCLVNLDDHVDLIVWISVGQNEIWGHSHKSDRNQ